MSCAASLKRFVAFALFAACSATLHASQTWYAVQSPHFRIVTDGSEKDGRTVAAEFEQMRHVFSSLYGREDFESGAPLTVMAARNLETFKGLEPAMWKARGDNLAGVFHTGWEKQFATVRLDTWTDSNQVVVYHEYSHSILHANIHWMPVWLDEGLAEYFAYTKFESDKTYVGAPSQRLRTIRNRPLFPVSEMLEVTNRSPLFKDDDKAQQFYGQSWAMVHFMNFGDGMDHGRKLQLFLKKLQDQEPQTQAFVEVFGDPKTFNDNLSLYLNHFTLSAGVMATDPKADPKAYTAHQLSPAEVAYEMGCFHIGLHDRNLGRPLIERAVQLDPKLAGPHEELGYLAFEQGKDDEAREEWQKAVALDPLLPRANYALLMVGKPLSAQTDSELLREQAGLQHVVALAPKFAPAYVELAIVEWRLNQMTQAFKDARAAEALAPWRAGYHTLTASILLRGHRPEMAAQFARYVAGHWYGSDHDEAVELWNQVPQANRGGGPALILDTPAGSTVARGTLTALTCGMDTGDDKLRLTLQPQEPSDAKPLTFTSQGRFMSGWSDTLWWGSDHYSLCHHLIGKPALVAFKPSGNESGDLLALEIRDDLPPLTKPASATGAAAAPKVPDGAAFPAAAPESSAGGATSP